MQNLPGIVIKSRLLSNTGSYHKGMCKDGCSFEDIHLTINPGCCLCVSRPSPSKLDYEKALLVTRYLASNRPFSQSFDIYLTQVLCGSEYILYNCVHKSWSSPKSLLWSLMTSNIPSKSPSSSKLVVVFWDTKTTCIMQWKSLGKIPRINAPSGKPIPFLVCFRYLRCYVKLLCRFEPRPWSA